MRSFQEIEHALTDKDGFSKRPNRPRPFKANLLGGIVFLKKGFLYEFSLIWYFSFFLYDSFNHFAVGLWLKK